MPVSNFLILPFLAVPASPQNIAVGQQTQTQSANKNSPKLLEELEQLEKEDQTCRKKCSDWMREYGQQGDKINPKLSIEEKIKILQEGKALFDRSAENDHKNLKSLRLIIDEFGWPTRSMVGEKGARMVWTLVQHADKDPIFQRRCLTLMGALPRQEYDITFFAYLTDRVLISEGKKQLYGTQFEIDSSGKHFVPKPIEDEINVDKRRAEVGLEPLSYYLKQSADFLLKPGSA